MRTTDTAVEIEERMILPGVTAIGCRPWPVGWSGVWVGVLAAIALTLLFGLIGIAVGAHQVGYRIVKWSEFGFWTLVFSVAGAFFSFVVGGWVAGRIGGHRRAEDAWLHGAIVWVAAVPFFLLLAALGAGSYFGGWHSGLAGTPGWATSARIVADPDAAIIARNSALGAVTALLLGLVGSVLGGWLASGEPMSLTYRRPKTS